MPPNILEVVVDDLSYWDVNGATDVNIPHILALLAQSQNFLDHHSSGASCTPSRCGLVTGNYGHRYGLQDNLKIDDTQGIPATVNTLPRHLSAYGYRTMHIGKWMLGWSIPAYYPIGVGFTTAFWFRHGIDLANPGRTYLNPWLRKNNNNPEQQMGHITEILTQKAIDKMAAFEAEEEPWFIALWHYSCHAPHQAPAKWASQYPNTPRGQFLANLAHLDSEIGRLLENVPENTIVILTSDNGGEGAFHPDGQYFRGTKGTAYEAGHRVPFMVRGTGFTPGDVDFLSSHLDVFPTLSALCGLPVPECDGMDYSEVWLGNVGPDVTRRLFWQFTHDDNVHQTWGERRKEYKLVGIEGQATNEFYKLDTDPQETTDVASLYPEKVVSFEGHLDDWRADVGIV